MGQGRSPGQARRNPPIANPHKAGIMKLRFKLLVEAFRHASSGPTPVKNNRKMAIGTFTLLKNGASTVTRSPPPSHFGMFSEITGNIVPQKTAKHDARSMRLLNRKLLSRETTDSISLSLF